MTTQERLALFTCTTCGAPTVANPRHSRCQACQDKDPRQASELRASRALAISRARHRDAALAAEGYPDPQAWETIRLALAGVGLEPIMQRCGVSKSTAWSWKRGHTRPAPGHWAALAELAQRPN